MTTQTEALKLALDLAALHHTDDGYAELRSKVRQLAKEALAQPEQEPVEDLQAKLKWATEQLEANINWEFVAAAKEEMLKAAWAEIKELREQIKEPEQEPVAIHQFRSPHCADWYDGIPDHHDGHGPYEVRTLYTTPPQRTWVGLTDEDVEMIVENRRAAHWEFVRQVETLLKEKNNA